MYLKLTDDIPVSDLALATKYDLYLWLALPISSAAAIIMLFFRPIYILALCDLYSDFLKETGEAVTLPESPRNSVSATIIFGALCLILIAIFFYHKELGILGSFVK